jgi:predicted peptidase
MLTPFRRNRTANRHSNSALKYKRARDFTQNYMLESSVGGDLVGVFVRALIPSLFLCMLAPVPALAKKRETGFIDRTLTIQAVTYKYQVFVPEDWTPHRKWPVILALHGAGERGSDGLLQTDVGIGTAIRTDRDEIEAIVVMPQCAKNLLPPMDELAMTALADATKEFRGDTRRTYLTGLSMGGYGAWHLAQEHPGTFAALVVICGGIRPPIAAQKALPALAKITPPDSSATYLAAATRVGKTPVWIFHGANDDIVPVTESQRMTEAMKQIGAEVHYTEYPGIGHPCWNKAYDEPQLFPWLFSKSLPD